MLDFSDGRLGLQTGMICEASYATMADSTISKLVTVRIVPFLFTCDLFEKLLGILKRYIEDVRRRREFLFVSFVSLAF